jgi:hypothetical protein
MQGLETLSNKVLNNTFFAMASIIAKLTAARDLESFVQYRLYIVHCITVISKKIWLKQLVFQHTFQVLQKRSY